MAKTYSIAISCYVERAHSFVQWLKTQGHDARVTQRGTSLIAGIDVDVSYDAWCMLDALYADFWFSCKEARKTLPAPLNTQKLVN